MQAWFWGLIRNHHPEEARGTLPAEANARLTPDAHCHFDIFSVEAQYFTFYLAQKESFMDAAAAGDETRKKKKKKLKRSCIKKYEQQEHQ